MFHPHHLTHHHHHLKRITMTEDQIVSKFKYIEEAVLLLTKIIDKHQSIINTQQQTIDNQQMIIDGMSDIIQRLNQKP